MSSYEAEREARIASNNQLLKTLGIQSARDAVGEVSCLRHRIVPGFFCWSLDVSVQGGGYAVRERFHYKDPLDAISCIICPVETYGWHTASSTRNGC